MSKGDMEVVVMGMPWTVIVKNDETGEIHAPVFNGSWNGDEAMSHAISSYETQGLTVVCVLKGVQTEGVYPTPVSKGSWQ